MVFYEISLESLVSILIAISSLNRVRDLLKSFNRVDLLIYAHLSKDSLHKAANSASKQIMAAMGA
ncbi:hypothetical protein MGP2080_08601 [marine gamma proteobacterium HTCC2080]|nr:hypothetical protein MGP2080_08601 [marine gamma proteobacterium HTCC2080]